jgi:hypothetical protein
MKVWLKVIYRFQAVGEAMYYMLIYEMIGVVKLKQGLTKVNEKNG